MPRNDRCLGTNTSHRVFRFPNHLSISVLILTKILSIEERRLFREKLSDCLGQEKLCVLPQRPMFFPQDPPSHKATSFYE